MAPAEPATSDPALRTGFYWMNKLEVNMTLNDRQRKMGEESKWDFSNLKALFLNCTLKPTPELSHTDGRIEIAKAIMGCRMPV